MNNIIQIESLSKYFNDLKAIDDVTYSVNKGEMFGLVGPDGAGKSTTIRILCGLFTPTCGKVHLFGSDITKEKKHIQNQIGYLSQKFNLYGDLSIDENIEFFAEIHEIKNFNARRDELLEFTRLTPFRNRLADKLSGGMKQKLALACSLIHKPKILFLDEPTTGVDPVSRRDFWKILSDLLKEDITIFMTTPYLDEAERCNRVALMHKSKIISLDTPQKLKQSINKNTLEIICPQIQLAASVLTNNLNYDVQLFGDRINIMVENHQYDLNKIRSILEAKAIPILEYRLIQPSLENVFIHLVSKSY
jgi:ABC-2 type transport system ATP-binding protein